MRTVTFGSRPGRIAWALIGAAMLAAGYILVAPSFQATPPAPLPWGLWVGTDSEYRGPEADTSLTLTIDAAGGCEKPVVASGEISWDSLNSLAHFAGHHPPTRQFNYAHGHANCKHNERLISGGLRLHHGSITAVIGHFQMVASDPIKREWSVTASSDMGGAARADFFVVASCERR